MIFYFENFISVSPCLPDKALANLELINVFFSAAAQLVQNLL